MRRRALVAAAASALAAAAAAAPAQAQDDVVGCTLGWATSPTEQTWDCVGPQRARPVDLEAVNDAFCRVQITIHRLTAPADDPMPVSCLALPPRAS